MIHSKRQSTQARLKDYQHKTLDEILGQKLSEWVLRWIKGYSKYVGFSTVGFEEQPWLCLRLRKIFKNPKLRKAWEEWLLGNTCSKGKRELRNLNSSINYDAWRPDSSRRAKVIQGWGLVTYLDFHPFASFTNENGDWQITLWLWGKICPMMLHSLSWNLRDLNNPNKLWWWRTWWRCDVVSLLETKIDETNGSNVRSIWASPLVDWVALEFRCC